MLGVNKITETVKQRLRKSVELFSNLHTGQVVSCIIIIVRNYYCVNCIILAYKPQSRSRQAAAMAACRALKTETIVR